MCYKMGLGKGIIMPGNLKHNAIFIKIVEKIQKLLQLQDNWDGYGGAKINPAVAKNIKKFLKDNYFLLDISWNVVPLSNGGIQLEKAIGDGYMEMEFDQDCVELFTCRDSDKQIAQSIIKF